MLGSLLLLVCTMPAAPGANEITIGDLRCEYLVNPVGIDTPKPRLSWTLESTRRGARVTAYQVVVTTDPARSPDLWDSGKIGVNSSAPATSSALPYVEYNGKPLASRTRAHWHVRVWDEHDEPSAYSAWATFEIAFLDPADWKAAWISSEAPRQVNPAIRTANWIWAAQGDPKVTAPEGERYFCKRFDLPDVKIDEARLFVTADDEFGAMINGHPVLWGKWPAVGAYDVTKFMRPGARNAVAVQATNLGGSAGVIATLVLKYKGETHTIVTDKTWKVLEQPIEDWPTAKLDDAKWPAVAEVTKFGGAPWRQLDQQAEIKPAPHLRKSFDVKRAVKQARVYVCGLGYCELTINGNPAAGLDRLQPGYTRYDRRALYNTYDVTSQLQQGRNAIGVILGNGWFNFHPKAVWNFDKAPWRSDPVLKLQLEITYEDGSRELVVSDESWKWSTGPILSDQLFIGEVYDARKEINGWDEPAYDDQNWKPVSRRKGPAGKLVAQAMPPIRPTGFVGPVTNWFDGPDTLRRPVRCSEPKPGLYVFDMGQGFAGVALLSAEGPSGTTITLKYGERLNPDGTVDQRDINAHAREGRFQTDTFILRGDSSPEGFFPRFGYYGFQYVEVRGLPQAPDPDTLIGVVMRTDYERVGTFECSNPLLNQIYKNTRWSYGANFHGIPTDCPHREKNGWTGDAHLAAEQAMFNFNNVPAYEKWMNDFLDEQRESGELPGIVPTAGWGYNWGNGPAWDSAYLLIPWYLYEYYGDRRVLEQHYDRMKRYVDYLTSRADKDHIVSIGLGDWVPVKTQTPVEHTSTGYYYVDALIVSKVARLIGNSDDATKYATLAEAIRTSYRTRLAGQDGLYSGSQTALSCVLYQDIAADDTRDKLVHALVANVEAQNRHLDCGILGTKYLLHALTDNGRADLAYAVASQATFPSWGAWIREHAATTLWECWDGTSSRMHIMFGDVSAWMFSGLAGIAPDPEHPGFAHFFIRPNPVGDLTYARGEYHSIRGLIVSSWKRDGERFTLDVRVPPGTTATLSLPCRSIEDAKEGDRPVNAADGVKAGAFAKGRYALELQSGHYRFSTQLR